jgi:hypothetical protein
MGLFFEFILRVQTSAVEERQSEIAAEARNLRNSLLISLLYSREFGAETSSQLTASSARQSGLHQLTFERSRAGSHLDAEKSFSPPQFQRLFRPWPPRSTRRAIKFSRPPPLVARVADVRRNGIDPAQSEESCRVYANQFFEAVNCGGACTMGAAAAEPTQDQDKGPKVGKAPSTPADLTSIHTADI